MKPIHYLCLTALLVACAQTAAFNDIPPGDFTGTDSDVNCYMDCTDPAPECADDCESARLDDNIYLSIIEGE